MAGMIPERRTKREIEQASQKLAERSQAYIDTWRDAQRVTHSSAEAPSKPRVDAPKPETRR